MSFFENRKFVWIAVFVSVITFIVYFLVTHAYGIPGKDLVNTTFMIIFAFEVGLLTISIPLIYEFKKDREQAKKDEEEKKHILEAAYEGIAMIVGYEMDGNLTILMQVRDDLDKDYIENERLRTLLTESYMQGESNMVLDLWIKMKKMQFAQQEIAKNTNENYFLSMISSGVMSGSFDVELGSLLTKAYQDLRFLKIKLNRTSVFTSYMELAMGRDPLSGDILIPPEVASSISEQVPAMFTQDEECFEKAIESIKKTLYALEKVTEGKFKFTDPDKKKI